MAEKKSSPVMSLAAASKVEAIKVNCDVKGKEIFAVLGRKAKEGKPAIPARECAAIVNSVYSKNKLQGVTLMRNGTPVIDAAKALVAANNEIFKNNAISMKYMQTFVAQKCAEKNNGVACPL